MIRINYSEIIFKTILAIILSGLIGIERQNKNRPAGFKTHILVCLGSLTIMILSELIFVKYYTLYGVTNDPARLAAQVVNGIGFLGAGTIIHHGISVKGLTTAATLWVVAAIGLAVGAGFYFLAIIVTVFILITLLAFNILSRKFNRVGNTLELKIDLINKPKTLGIINMVFAKNNFKIIVMEITNSYEDSLSGNQNTDLIALKVVLEVPPETELYSLIKTIEGINGVLKVERI